MLLLILLWTFGGGFVLVLFLGMVLVLLELSQAVITAWAEWCDWWRK